MSENVINVYGPLKARWQNGYVTELEQIKGYLTIAHYASYNATTQKIEFRHDQRGEVLFDIDARPFVKDGMINRAELQGNELVLGFNTDAGITELRVPLQEIFTPDNYFTKEEIEAMFREHDLVKVFSGIVEDIAITQESHSGDNVKCIFFDKGSNQFVYRDVSAEGTIYYGNWATADEYMNGDKLPLPSKLFYDANTNILYFFELGELKPITVDLTEIKDDIAELMDAVFPLDVSLVSVTNTASTTEFTGEPADLTLRWTVKRKNQPCVPSQVIIRKQAPDGAVTELDNIENPTSHYGDQETELNAKGTTKFTVNVTAEGLTKQATVSFTQILPSYLGFGEDQSLLEDNITAGNMEKYLNLNGWNGSPDNPVEGYHLIIAVPEGRTVTVTNQGVMPVPMTEAKTDKRTINGTDYSYNVFYSANPIVKGAMEDIKITVS